MAIWDRLATAVHHGYIQALSASLHTVFLWATPVAALAFLVALTVPELPLRQTSRATDPAETWAPSAKPASRSSLDEIARALSVLMSRETAQHIYARIASQAGLGLDPRTTWMLLRLADQADGDLGAIGQRFGIPLGALSAFSDTLCDRGLACRVGTRLSLTDDGRQAASALVAVRREMLAELVADWQPDQHADLAALLTRLAGGIASEPALPPRNP